MAIVSESGLYQLIFSSRKPQAKAFRRWVTGTVLPSIRKTGGYQTKDHVRTLGLDGDGGQNALTMMLVAKSPAPASKAFSRLCIKPKLSEKAGSTG